MKLVPKNWTQFQHYKNRQPPWIKLHRNLLDDREFVSLPLASKALAPLMWLLASESENGVFDASPEELAFRLRVSQKDVTSALKPLINKGFFLDASTMLAPCLQDARPEGEGEGEKRQSGFTPPSLEEVRSYIKSNGYPVDADRFVNFYESKGWMIGKNKMKEWQAAVRTWAKSSDKNEAPVKPWLMGNTK